MKKIMFSDKYFLTKAVLEGRKTQTRRIINPQPRYDDNIGICWRGYAYGINLSKEGTYNNFISGTEYDKSCKRYRVGEVLAIAQAYNDFYYDGYNPTLFPSGEGWTNKMFVKSELMPHQIRITNVRIQKLQDISDEDCLAGGIEQLPSGGGYNPYAFYDHSVRVKTEKEGVHYGEYRDFYTPREAYAELIDKVSGKGTWEIDPYVWVYEFELVK